MFIETPGSYILTSNLDVRNEVQPERVKAFDIRTENVTLDLNGFTIIGPNVCSEDGGINCTLSGTVGIGITSNDDRITVKNGQVISFEHICLSLTGLYINIQDLTIAHCGRDAIRVGIESSISNNVISFTGDDGIEMSTGLASGNIITRTEGFGVEGSIGTALINNYFGSNYDGNFQSAQQIGGNMCGTILCP